MSERPADARADSPAHRYDAALADSIERSWQERWRKEGTYHAPNPTGPLAEGDTPDDKLYVLDMFPYPSAAGLHVGHPLGFIGTDVYARFQRMRGRNVLHAMGFDAFGLPAEEYARSTGTHPRATTEANIANYRRQLTRLGLGHDERRSVATTDVDFYRWTQWIFLQIFGAWYDDEAGRARPVADLVEQFQTGARAVSDGRPWSELDDVERRRVVDDHRLVYLDDAVVNWCPGLGTVLANEEVTAEGRSDRGNHPVFRRTMRQWKMRITAYADRLLDDLDLVRWPEPVKTMQRNWIGRSEGASIRFDAGTAGIEVFTTRPDTVFGATYLVLAPEHPLVDTLVADAWPDDTPASWTGGYATPATAVDGYRAVASARTELDRQAESREKTGVWLGVSATNPVDGRALPVFVADYVLMGYGTGAIMAVPGQDQRDWDFAIAHGLPIIRTVEPPDSFDGEAYVGEGRAVNSGFLDGLGVADAKRTIVDWLEEHDAGAGRVTYKLRDWLFSRQRYWGEPFPIVFDETGLPIALPETELPVELPELIDWAPRALDVDSDPEPPLGRADEWATVTLDLGDGPRPYRRELNTMPQWAGSCWYYLRYLDPTNDAAFVDPAVERYWMTDTGGGVGGVDLYVGGVEHAVLHLLYARFWHKVLYDLGHVSGPEPFRRLFNQGYILAAAFVDERGVHVEAAEVVERDGSYLHDGRPVTREAGKMGKSLKNSVSPDEMYETYGADTLRLYEMSMGPMDQDRPWETRAVSGPYRLLQRVWRNVIDEDTGESVVTGSAPADDTLRVLHRTIADVTADMERMRFNTAIARLTELNNHLTKQPGPAPRAVVEPLVLMLAPLVPHVAEELWSRLGHDDSLVRAPWPVADESYLVTETIELPVQVDGKVRTRITVPADAPEDRVRDAALADADVARWLDGAEPRRVVVVPGRLVNVVR